MSEGTPVVSRPTRSSSRPQATPAPATGLSSRARKGSKRQRREQQEKEEESTTDRIDVEGDDTSSSPSQSSSSVTDTPNGTTSTTTPLRGVGVSGMAPPLDTPNRKARLEEKAELQDLNKRLELYIMRVRERDATSGGFSRELDFINAQHAAELDNVKKAFDERIELLRTQRTEHAQENAHLQQEVARLDDENKRLAGELSTEQSARQAVEKRVKQLTADLQIAQDRMIRAEEDRTRLMQDLDSARSEADFATSQIKKITESSNDAISRATIAEQTALNLQQDVELLRKSREQELQSLQDQVTELTNANLKVEDTLRKEFGQQLKDILADRQIQYEEEKEAGLNALREMYEIKLQEYRDNMERATYEIDESNRRLQELSEKVEDERRQHQAAIGGRQALELQIQNLQDEKEQMRKTHAQDLAHKNESVRQYLASIKRKDEEFQTLMDVKVALDMEIKSYRLLLENEEDRLGYLPQIQSRTNGSARRPSLSSSPASSSLQITGASASERRITVVNRGNRVVSFAGYSLRAGDESYTFPANVTVNPGDTIDVYTGTSTNAPDGAFAWPVQDEDLWEHADAIILYDSQNQEKSSFSLV